MSSTINLLTVVIIIQKHWKRLSIHFLLISIAAVIFAFNLTKIYKSELVFMPKSSKGSGLFNLIGTNFAADLFGESPFSKRQYIALLHSREIQEDLIKKFNLIEVYKLQKRPNALDLALKNLEDVIKISESEEGGLGITDVISVTISVTDKSPQRAADMANYLYEAMLNKIKVLNNSEYDVLCNFLVKQTSECDSLLNINRNALKEFQLANHIYNIPQQISLVLQNLSATKAQLMAVENEMNYLKRISTSDYSGILSLQMKRNSLLEKISEIENSQSTDVFLGLKKSVNLSN
ncbi:MAG: hypothetical protein JW795_00400, partial [Chitinivibrionales bacterium]|nr:hypothetical protein [Chitinivibrionales bacterium]